MGSQDLSLLQQGVTFLRSDYPQSYPQILGIAAMPPFTRLIRNQCHCNMDADTANVFVV